LFTEVVGHTHGPVTRLMSPGDLGEILKPFVFLDRIDNEGKTFCGFGLHPHSGIATLTYIVEGSVAYEEREWRRRPIIILAPGRRRPWSREENHRAFQSDDGLECMQ
jgi:hypothetical protein